MYEGTFPNKRFKLTLEFLKKHVPHSQSILDLGVNNPFSEIMGKDGYRVENTSGEDLDVDTSTIENSENELNNIIDTYKDVMSEYESKANELGIDVETIAEYNFIDTRVFEANQQLEIASELKDSINNI